MHATRYTAEDAVLTMHYPAFIFHALKKDGYCVETLLAGTGLTEDLLGDPNFRCYFWQVRQFIHNAVELTDDPNLGARLALRFEPNQIGLPAYTAMNAACFSDALQVLNRFFFLTFPAIELRFPDREARTAPGETSVCLRPKLQFGDITYFAFSSALFVCDGLFKAALRSSPVVLRADMAIPEPDGWSEFSAKTDVNVRFGADQNRLYFSADLLDRTLPGADLINHRRFLALCAQLAAEQEVETSLASQVVAFLETDENLGAPLAEAAASLGCSERGLRRRLERTGASYRKLVDQVRETRAKEMLANTSQPIQAIAHELGFDAPSNFARSFKRWTGATPRAFRDGRRIRGGAGQN